MSIAACTILIVTYGNTALPKDISALTICIQIRNFFSVSINNCNVTTLCLQLYSMQLNACNAHRENCRLNSGESFRGKILTCGDESQMHWLRTQDGYLLGCRHVIRVSIRSTMTDYDDEKHICCRVILHQTQRLRVNLVTQIQINTFVKIKRTILFIDLFKNNACQRSQTKIFLSME